MLFSTKKSPIRKGTNEVPIFTPNLLQYKKKQLRILLILGFKKRLAINE